MINAAKIFLNPELFRAKKEDSKQFCSESYILEVPPRFELGNKGFADLCLTTWPWHHMTLAGTFAPAKLFGADYEARTRYLHLGKVALYQMS